MFILQDGTLCGSCFSHGFDLCENFWLQTTVLRKFKERHEPGTASLELTETWTGESRHGTYPTMCILLNGLNDDHDCDVMLCRLKRVHCNAVDVFLMVSMMCNMCHHFLCPGPQRSVARTL